MKQSRWSRRLVALALLSSGTFATGIVTPPAAEAEVLVPCLVSGTASSDYSGEPTVPPSWSARGTIECAGFASGTFRLDIENYAYPRSVTDPCFASADRELQWLVRWTEGDYSGGWGVTVNTAVGLAFKGSDTQRWLPPTRYKDGNTLWAVVSPTLCDVPAGPINGVALFPTSALTKSVSAPFPAYAEATTSWRDIRVCRTRDTTACVTLDTLDPTKSGVSNVDISSQRVGVIGAGTLYVTPEDIRFCRNPLPAGCVTVDLSNPAADSRVDLKASPRTRWDGYFVGFIDNRCNEICYPEYYDTLNGTMAFTGTYEGSRIAAEYDCSWTSAYWLGTDLNCSRRVSTAVVGAPPASFSGPGKLTRYPLGGGYRFTAQVLGGTLTCVDVAFFPSEIGECKLRVT